MSFKEIRTENGRKMFTLENYPPRPTRLPKSSTSSETIIPKKRPRKKVKVKRFTLEEKLQVARDAGKAAAFLEAERAADERTKRELDRLKGADREFSLKLLETKRQALQAMAMCCEAISHYLAEAGFPR